MTRQIAEEIATVRLDEGPGISWSRVLARVNEVLVARVPFFVRLVSTEGGWRVETCDGVSESVAQAWHGWFESRSSRAVASLAELADADGIHRAWQRCGLLGQDLIRLQVRSHGVTAWLGAYRPMGTAFGARERLVLRALLHAVTKRLQHEEMVRQFPVMGAGLRAALNAVHGPAVVLGRDGQVVEANAAGRKRLRERERPPRSVGGAAPWKVLHAEDGVSVATLETQTRSDPRHIEPQWLLTPRERQTLELILEGLSNRTIAGALDCSERTVEVHVSRLLAKSGSVSRAQLIARFVSRARSS